MRPHPRIRKTIKWGGLCVAGVMVVVMVCSAWKGSGPYWTTSNGQHVVSIYQGELVYWGLPLPPSGKVLSPKFGWDHWAISRPRIVWWFVQERPTLETVVEVPLWMPIVVTLLASAVASRLDLLAARRARVGMCPKCSYPRTGLAPSSPCPECGSAAPSA